jgi:type VI secretion system protein VasD
MRSGEIWLMASDSVSRTRRSAGCFLTVTAALLMLAGCGSAPELPEPTKVDIVAMTSDNANRGLPVVLRLYELRAAGSFEAADFFELYDNESATLGADLLAREQVDMNPGQVQYKTRTTDPATHYLGAIAAFRDLDGSSWRALMPLDQNTTNSLRVRIEADSVTIEPK